MMRQNTIIWLTGAREIGIRLNAVRKELEYAKSKGYKFEEIAKFEEELSGQWNEVEIAFEMAKKDENENVQILWRRYIDDEAISDLEREFLMSRSSIYRACNKAIDELAPIIARS